MNKRTYPADSVSCANCGEKGLRPHAGKPVYCVSCKLLLEYLQTWYGKESGASLKETIEHSREKYGLAALREMLVVDLGLGIKERDKVIRLLLKKSIRV